MQSNGQAFKPGTQEKIHPFKLSLFLLSFFIAGLQNSSEFGNRQITIYEIDNTPLPQQYRGWMHSTVSQLRQHADEHAKQREHARGLRL